MPGDEAESFVQEMTWTPAVYGPSSRGSKQVPAVHVTTSSHEVSSVQLVRSARRTFLQDFGRESLQLGSSLPLLVPTGTMPQGTVFAPHDVVRTSCLAGFSHSARSVPAASVLASTFLAQRWYALPLAASAHGQAASVAVPNAAKARWSASVESPVRQASWARAIGDSRRRPARTGRAIRIRGDLPPRRTRVYGKSADRSGAGVGQACATAQRPRTSRIE